MNGVEDKFAHVFFNHSCQWRGLVPRLDNLSAALIGHILWYGETPVYDVWAYAVLMCRPKMHG